MPHLLEQGLDWTAIAVCRAERLGDPILQFWAATRRLLVCACAGNIGEIDRYLDRSSSLALQLDQPTLSWLSAIGRAGRAVIAGDTDRVEPLATEALPCKA